MPDTFDPSLLSGYLDNELTTAQTAVVKQALAQNAELRQELEDIRKLRVAIAALPLPPVHSDLINGVRQRIELQRAERLSPMVHGAPATLKMLLSFAVAACVLLAVGWTILQNRTTPKTVALDPSSEQPPEQPPKQKTEQVDSLPVADAMAPEAGLAEAGLAEAALAEAMVEPPTQQRVEPQRRMMLKAGRQGPSPATSPATSADEAPAPRSADFAPLAMDAAPQLAEAGPRMARAMAVPAEAAAGDSAVAARPLEARYLMRRQLSEEPLANTARAAQVAAAPANAKPQLIVSTLRKDQLDAALQWWRDRVQIAPAGRPQATLDPATQVLAVAGDAAAVAKLSADWDRYMQQIHGQTRRQPLAVPATAGAGMSRLKTPEPETAESETPATAAPNVAAPNVDDARQSTANGMLAIEFRIIE